MNADAGLLVIGAVIFMVSVFIIVNIRRWK